ncbi:hypothetical protein FOQG_16315 [Fusarium oxysporum f. sp. raphani 54005]|uniref:Helicase C-terminal domain-containing protein n=1 Tax=Fusarium oxysporum f. sp. raphani 54005 TaxID=1089458 RepID=X0C8K9_FUSOX|nr:hypothetical protein FOQG_16315 [Fusarium oxysporum f. sp. raphani 54005]
MKMRMRCNYGTFSSSEGRLVAVEPMHLETECETCLIFDEDNMADFKGDLVCPECDRQLEPPAKSSQNEETAMDQMDGTTVIEERAINARKNEDFDFSTDNAHSTKLWAVADRIVKSGPGAKSLVFSSWTSTLDLISQRLARNQINHVLVDGRVTNAKRIVRMKSFKEDPQVTVLLMSIGTGAVGLNLTAANYVHIVEPQWNPSVEEQAIARALRMGQTRSVTVFRYMMKDTVEQSILELQHKKKQLASFTFNSEVGESFSDRLKDLRLILGEN